MSCEEQFDPNRLARDELRFRKRVIELTPKDELRIDTAAWRDAIVFLETGEVELECSAGERRRFAAGAVLCLVPPVRALRNCGDDSARLIAISRRTRTRPTRTD
jgi:hypothetical protein